MTEQASASGRKRVYLHVGSPKSGTTYLQSVLRQNADLLAAAGVLVAGSTHVELVHAGLVIREDPRAEKQLNDHERGSWQRVLEQIGSWTGHAAIISYELLAAAGADQARRAIEALGDVEVHVVITARDLARSVVSGWQERLKFRLTVPLEEVGPREDGEFGWLTLDPRGVAERWGATLPPEQVHIVTVPADPAAPYGLWQRFAEACGLDAIAGLDLSDTVANESLSPVTAELLRRFNAGLGESLRTNREQAIWLRDTLAHQVLVPQGGGSLGVTDEQFERWHRRSLEVVEELAGRGYSVHGDLADLVRERSTGRLPSEVATDELLDAALASMKGLLDLLVQAHTATADGPEQIGFRTRAGRLVRRAGVRLGAPALRAEFRNLERQLAEAQQQIQADRELHQRVADLDDLVTHLLLPSAGGGDEALARAVTAYRDQAL